MDAPLPERKAYLPWPEPVDDAPDSDTDLSYGDGTWLSWLSSTPGRGCALYCAVYTALGLCLSTFGPVILDLASQTNASLPATGYCLIIRSLGYLGGSFCGFLYDFLPGHRLLALAMALASVGTVGITLARSSLALAATVSLQGMAMGLIDTGANLLLLWLFKDKAGPPMQAMHCAFAVGATVGPFLENLVEGASGVPEGATVGVGTYNPAFYIISAGCAVLCVLLLLTESPSARTAEAAPSAAQECSSSEVGSGGTAPTVAAAPMSVEAEKWRIIFVTATLLGIYVGVETGYGSYVTAYSVLYVGSSESRGQLLAGCYWAAIMVGRFASIWIASLLSPSLFLRLTMVASAVCAIFLLLLGGSDTGLWIGSLGFGLAMACVYPTTLTLAESFFPIMGRHVTVIMIGSASGEMALPFVIATLFGGSTPQERTGAQSPQVLIWMMALACSANAAVLYLLLALGKRIQGRLALIAAQAPAMA